MSKQNLNAVMQANSKTVIHGPMAVGSITQAANIPTYFFENMDMTGYLSSRYLSYEWTLFSSLLDGMQAMFKWEGLPDGIRSGDLERAIISAGRVKLIKVGATYQFVRIAPTK